MAKIKLSLQSIAVSEKINLARQIVASMNGNAIFPNPDPPLPDITSAAIKLEDAYNAANTARLESASKTSLMDDAEAGLDQLLTKLANYIESTTTGDESKILSSGMSVRAKKTPIGQLPAPEALSADADEREGAIVLEWSKVYGAKSYIIEKSGDPPTQTSWQIAGVSTKAKAVVVKLTSGKRYWFRVAAIGTAGQGPWSDSATKYAP